MLDTNEQKIAREEIIDAANYLVRLCQKHKTAVAGFVWGVEIPMIFSFGNTREQHDIPALSEMYLKLCSMVEDRITDGNVETRHVDRLQ